MKPIIIVKKCKKRLSKQTVNTAETNLQLHKVVENQNAYIDILKNQLSVQTQQLEFNEQQLSILKNIFASGEDGVAVEKEILNLNTRTNRFKSSTLGLC